MYKNLQNNVEEKEGIMISYSLMVFKRPGKVKCVLICVYQSYDIGHPPKFERHLKAFGRKHHWLEKVVPREAFGPGITRKVTMLIK